MNCRKYLDPLLSYPYLAIIPLLVLSVSLEWVSRKLEKTS